MIISLAMLKLLYDVIDDSRTLMQYHQQHFTMILIVLYIFILIYPCYISILLYRLYSTILYIWLHIMSLQPGAYLLYLLVQSYMLLSIFIMIYRHEHIYSIHLPILSMLLSGTCFQLFISFMASMLPYFYMIHIAFVSWPWCFPLPHTHVSTYTHILYSLYICFHVP